MKHTDFQRLVAEAKANREVFLAPYKERFDSLTHEWRQAKERNTADKLFKKRAKIIIDLIKLEPSHLDEPWIKDEYTEWLRRHDCLDFIEQASMAQKGRRRPTIKQQVQWAKDFFLTEKVDRLYKEEKARKEEFRKRLVQATDRKSDDAEYYMTIEERKKIVGKKERITRESIFSKLADKSESSRFIPNLESHHNPDALIKKAYYRHQKRNKRKLPYPYYGYDITENMIQGIGQKVEIDFGGGRKTTLWGDWIIKT
jgi:hypothetical protein